MKYYLDEDISPRVAELLRKNRVEAISAHEQGMIGTSDEQQLLAAAKAGRAMVTRNRNDFIRLTVSFFEGLKPHHGSVIIPHYIPGHDFSLMARLLSHLADEYPNGMTPYTIKFLSIGP